jgi:hypothetical protein
MTEEGGAGRGHAPPPPKKKKFLKNKDYKVAQIFIFIYKKERKKEYDRLNEKII